LQFVTTDFPMIIWFRATSFIGRWHPWTVGLVGQCFLSCSGDVIDLVFSIT
jgi:hypothetical protein